MLDSLIQLDQQLLFWFNGSNSLFIDQLALVLTSGLTWVPLYITLFYMVVKNNETMLQIVLVVAGVALCLLLSEGVTEGIVKPLVARWRPSNDPIIKYTVEVVGNLRSTDYGFFSAHAANTMGAATFFSLLVRDRLFITALAIWSLVNCWTRMYLGLHYPSDILCGLIWGLASGAISYFVFRKFYYKVSPKINYISSQYTSTGYSRIDIDIVMMVMVTTLVYAVLAPLTVA